MATSQTIDYPAIRVLEQENIWHNPCLMLSSYQDDKQLLRKQQQRKQGSLKMHKTEKLVVTDGNNTKQMMNGSKDELQVIEI